MLGRRELDRAITQSLFDNNLLLYYCQENCEGFVELIKDGTKLAKLEAISPSKSSDLSGKEHHCGIKSDDCIVTSEDGSHQNHYIPRVSFTKVANPNQSGLISE